MNSPQVPPSPPAQPSDNLDKGSLLIGFLIGWAAMIGGGVVGGVLITVLAQVLPYSAGGAFNVLGSLSGLIVPGVLVGLIIWYVKKGKSRTALGVALAFASAIALAILLIAACFGMMANTTWR